MFSSERADWLTTQYVWVIQNERVWAALLKVAAQEKNFAKFRRHVGSAVNESRKRDSDLRDEPFNEADRTFVVLMLWQQSGGDSGDMGNDHLFYVMAAASHGIAYNYTGQSVLRMKNPCGEIPMPTDAFGGIYTEASFHNEFSVQFGQKETNMSNPSAAIAFEVKTYIYGQDVKDMTEAQLIEAIKKLEHEIAKLKEVKTVSKKITGNIAKLEESLASIVAALDATA